MADFGPPFETIKQLFTVFEMTNETTIGHRSIGIQHPSEEENKAYDNLDIVQKFVIDNVGKFKTGYPITLMHIDGHNPNSISRILGRICDMKRLRINQIKSQLHYYEDGKDGVAPKRTTIYTLKSRDEIPEIYNIIDRRGMA